MANDNSPQQRKTTYHIYATRTTHHRKRCTRTIEQQARINELSALQQPLLRNMHSYPPGDLENGKPAIIYVWCCQDQGQSRSLGIRNGNSRSVNVQNAQGEHIYIKTAPHLLYTLAGRLTHPPLRASRHKFWSQRRHLTQRMRIIWTEIKTSPHMPCCHVTAAASTLTKNQFKRL